MKNWGVAQLVERTVRIIKYRGLAQLVERTVPLENFVESGCSSVGRTHGSGP